MLMSDDPSFEQLTLNFEPLNKQVGGNHYKSLKIQPVEYILANELGWCEGNIVKYITRWRQKNGLDDVRKVIHYAEILLAEEEKKMYGSNSNTGH